MYVRGQRQQALAPHVQQKQIQIIQCKPIAGLSQSVLRVRMHHALKENQSTRKESSVMRSPEVISVVCVGTGRVMSSR